MGFPDADYMTDAARTEGEFKTSLESFLAAAKSLPGGQAETELTISAGSVTPTGAAHTIDTEANAAVDDLDAIALSLPEGRLLFLRAASTTRIVTVRHAAGGLGQIILNGAEELALDDAALTLILQRSGDTWREVGRLQSVGEWATQTDVAALDALVIGLLQVERREIPAAAFSPDATNGAEPLPGGLVIAATGATVDVYAFDSATKETVTYAFRLPDTWNGGPVTAQITCLPGDASASEGDRMEWEIVLNAQGHGDAWVSSGVSQVVSVAVPSTIQGAPIDTVVTSGITIGGDPQPGDWAVMQISRNVDSANDTMAFDAWLLACTLNITHGVEEA